MAGTSSTKPNEDVLPPEDHSPAEDPAKPSEDPVKPTEDPAIPAEDTGAGVTTQ